MTPFQPHNHPQDEAREPRRVTSEHGEAVRTYARGECPTPLELASYLDGRADQSLAERIEAHMLRCGACLAMTRAVRADDVNPQASLVFVPAHVLDAAMNLVEGTAERGHGSALQPAAMRRKALWISITERSAAAAAAIAIGVIGHHVGRSLTAAGDSSTIATASDASTDLSYGFFETDDLLASADLLTLRPRDEVAQ